MVDERFQWQEAEGQKPFCEAADVASDCGSAGRQREVRPVLAAVVITAAFSGRRDAGLDRCLQVERTRGGVDSVTQPRSIVSGLFFACPLTHSRDGCEIKR